MIRERKSSQHLMSIDLPKPEQVTSLRNSDNNQYESNLDNSMAKSYVFRASQMPQQLTFKIGANSGKVSSIFPQKEQEGKLSFKSSTLATKKQDTPTSTNSSQQQGPLNFKNRSGESSISETVKFTNFAEYRRLSGDGLVQSRYQLLNKTESPSKQTSSNLPTSGNTLQFKQPTTYKSVLNISPHSQGQISFKNKPTIQEALQQSVNMCNSTLKPISETQSQPDSNIGRLEKYKKQTFVNFSEQQNISIGGGNKMHKELSFNKMSGIHRPSNQQLNLQKTKASCIQPEKNKTNFSPSNLSNSFCHYPSYTNSGSTNLSKTSRQNNSPVDNSLLKKSQNTQIAQSIEQLISRKINKTTPTNQNSNFNKLKNSPRMSDLSSNSFNEKPPKRQIKLSDFKFGKKLGKGKFGDVFIVQDIATGFICALKIIKKSTLIEEKVDHQFSSQLKIQFHLNHPNIINLYGFFNDQTNFYMVLEYAVDGHLFGILKEKKRLTENQTKTIVKQVCEGVQTMHQKRILHRDLKPQNILIQFGIAKICDFGWAIYRADTLRDTLCGTPLYISPQVLTGQKYDQSADLWAVGILTYQLLVGKIPFKIRKQQDLIKIVNQQIVFPENSLLSQLSKDFVMSMLQRDVNVRLDVEQLLHHPFLLQSQ